MMLKNSPFLYAFIFLVSINIALAQPKFQCQLVKDEIKDCIRAKEDTALKQKVLKLYAPLLMLKSPTLKDTFPPTNFESLKPCNKVKFFSAYNNKKTGERIIFYSPKDSFLTSPNPNWYMKGLLLHAIAHLQLDHSDTLNAYDKELKADERTAILLKGLGANFEQAILHLKELGNPTHNMPDYETRWKKFGRIYFKPPTANFTYECNPLGCTEPCGVNFKSTSLNILPGTKYYWNDKELEKEFFWTNMSEGDYTMTLKVVNPDGQEHSIAKMIRINESPPRAYQKVGQPIVTENETDWGIHAGLNYSPSFNQFSFTGGVSFRFHPSSSWIGFQTELNYANRIDEFSGSESNYNVFWRDFDYTEYSYIYDVHNIELPVIAIFGRNKESFHINGLLGLSYNYSFLGDLTYNESTYYASGDYDYFFDFRPINFPYDYNRSNFNVITGIILGNNRISLGSRVNIILSDYYKFNPEIRTYIEFRF